MVELANSDRIPSTTHEDDDSPGCDRAFIMIYFGLFASAASLTVRTGTVSPVIALHKIPYFI
jgi:hypothetical protein